MSSAFKFVRGYLDYPRDIGFRKPSESIYLVFFNQVQ